MEALCVEPRAGATTPPTSAGLWGTGVQGELYEEEQGRGVPFAFQETPSICEAGGTSEVPGVVSAFMPVRRQKQ